MLMTRKILLTFLIAVITTNLVYSCSAVVLKNENQILLAKNFDWTYREGIVIKNLRGINKTAYFTHTGEPLQWVSKYGSVTFNQNGKEMPYGGMNEKGLTVEMLWLEQTKYNISEAKAYLNELEWIQFQLDNFETVQQVSDHLTDLKIYPIKGKIHYIITDKTGESVIIEYLNGKPTAYKKDANVCQTITNNSVLQSAPYKNQIRGIRKNNTAPTYRYYKLEQEILNIRDKKNEISEAYAFSVLKKVTIPKGSFKTMWSIVYNVNQKSISFFTDTHKEIKNLNLSELDFENNLAYFPLNQNEIKHLNKELKSFTEPVNYSYLSPSLMHLGFDEKLTKDVSQHQFLQAKRISSAFADNYFHFEISVPVEEERQTGFIAVMDSEESFNKRQAVTGGYLYGKVSQKGTLIIHIYGLKNGKYSMLTFIDDNRNRKLDFDKHGKATEKYATFSDSTFTNEQQITFSSTSADFNKANARVFVKWKQ